MPAVKGIRHKDTVAGRTQSRKNPFRVCYSVGMRLLSVICVVAVMVLILGCQRSQTVMTPGGAAKVTETSKDKGSVEMTVAGQKVRAEYGTGKIPDDFPKDIPIYASYKNAMAMNMGPSRTLHLFSNDTRSAISAFYEKELAAKGWKVDEVKRSPESDEFTATKDKRTVVVSVLEKGSDRTISITLLGQ